MSSVVIRLRNGEAARFDPSAANPKGAPVAFALPLPLQPPLASASRGAASICLTIGDGGLTVRYAIRGVAGKALRKRSGVPMLATENRLRFTLVQPNDPTKNDDPHRWIALTVNGNGNCVVHGDHLTEDQTASCKVASLPTPSPALNPPASPAPSFWCPDDTSAAAAQAPRLCGTATIGLDVLQTTFAPAPTERNANIGYAVCVAVVPAGRNESDLDARCQDPPPAWTRTVSAPASTTAPSTTPPSSNSPPASAQRLFQIAVKYEDESSGRYRLRGALGSGDNGSQSSGGGGSSSSGFARRPFSLLRAQSNAPSSSQSQGDVSGLGALLTFVHPFTYNARTSAELQFKNLVTTSDKQTQMYLSKLNQPELDVNQNGATVKDSATTDDTFQSFDSAHLFAVAQKPPARGVTTPKKATKPADAFDYTDLLDFEPFDPAAIKAVTYGGKAVWMPTSSLFATGYYRDYKEGASATMLHGEGTFGTTTFGASQIMANDDTASSNKYVTLGPDGTRGARKHSALTVLGATTDFAYHGAARLFARAGLMSTGNDYLAALSWSSPDGGRIYADDGSQASLSALLGYRAIDPVFDPLATRYNAFTGSQLVFARLGRATTSPGTKGDVQHTVAVSAARGMQGAVPVYSSVGASVAFPAGGPFSLNFTGARSTIAGSAVARQDGSVVVTGTNATTMLDNSFISATLTYAPSDTVSVSLGNAVAHTPTCDPKTGACSSAIARGRSGWTGSVLIGAVGRGLSSGVFDGSFGPGSLNQPNPGGTTIATNVMKASAVAAYHFLCSNNGGNGIEPALTVKNNIAEDESQFKPGLLIEAGVDIGLGSGGLLKGSAIRLSDKRVTPAPGQSLSGPAHTFTVTLVNPARWDQYQKLDRCAISTK